MAVVTGAVVPSIKVALQLVELYEMSRPTLVIISLESGLKWLNYGQFSPVTAVTWAGFPQIKGSFVAS